MTASEALLALAVPAVAARAGGIMLPLVRGLSQAASQAQAASPATAASSGSTSASPAASSSPPPTRSVGAFLFLTLFQTSAVSSSLFLTANNPNLLTSVMFRDLTGLPLTWGQWALAASVPCLASLLVIPALLHAFFAPLPGAGAAPEVDMKAAAVAQLAALGPFSRQQLAVLLSVGATVLLWVFGAPLGFNNVTSAIFGLFLLLASGSLRWVDDCLKNTAAFETFVWFGAVTSLASQLRPAGLVPYFAQHAGQAVQNLQLPPPVALALLASTYFYLHVFFANGVSHVGALYAAYLAVAMACGAPPFVAGFLLCILSNPFGAFTHYGMSTAPMLFAEGYVTLRHWLMAGVGVSVVNLLSMGVVGPLWWKLLGYY